MSTKCQLYKRLVKNAIYLPTEVTRSVLYNTIHYNSAAGKYNSEESI